MSTTDIFDGKVTAITKYGCFVAFGVNQSGMVHISEVSNDFVSDINQILKIGDHVCVKILKTDEQGRVSLSIKRAKKPQNIDYHYTPKKKITSQDDLSFDDKMKLFLTNSQERLTDVKHNKEKKTGGRRRK